MKEEIIQFIWKTGQFDQYALRSTCGMDLNILSPGIQNFNAGPDFFNAKVRIGNTTWAGNVELHLRSSDWVKHEHHLDGAYDNVILHVVMHADAPAFTSGGRLVQTLQLPDPTPLISFHMALQADESWLPCHDHIQKVSRVGLKHWLSLLQSERLEQKSRQVSNLLLRSKLNWEETLCLVMASSFGLPINSLPFEMTLTGIPYKLLMQNRESLDNLEALLFGKAGFLGPQQARGPYVRDLSERYSSFANELHSQVVNLHLWKFLRLRPASFPTLRISQFASLLHTRLPLLETLLGIDSVTEAEQILRVESSTYWDTHYLFGKCSPESRKVMGQQSVLTLIINGLVPFLFSFGHIMNHDAALKLGRTLLLETEAESNQLIKNWALYGIHPSGAFESQALIQLHNAYCRQKRCLDCQLWKQVNPLIL